MIMFHTRRAGLAAILAACAFTPTILAAQGSGSPGRAISVGLGGGVTVPSGDLSECCGSGFNLAGFLQWRQPDQVFGLRADAQFHRNDMKDTYLLQFPNAGAGTTGYYNIITVGGSAVLEVAPPGSAMGWYLLAGAGLYRAEASVTESNITVSSSDTQLGFNAGGGLRVRMGGASLFAETRWHTTKIEDATFSLIPLTIGISW
jgi:hypothetical protein